MFHTIYFNNLRMSYYITWNNTYDTITEEGVKIEDPGETKNHIADFYENLYQAREGKPEYQNWTDHCDTSQTRSKN